MQPLRIRIFGQNAPYAGQLNFTVSEVRRCLISWHEPTNLLLPTGRLLRRIAAPAATFSLPTG